MSSKLVGDSAVHHVPHQIFPEDLNSHRTIYGGRVVELADRLAGHVAQRHSGRVCVTLSADSIRFLAPAVMGETLVFKASVNRAWHTSMEVGVKVLAENYQTGESRHIVSAYFTFVAVDESMKPIAIPEILPESIVERLRFSEAQTRREQRLLIQGKKK